jgi:hypothetical protein
VNRSSDYHILAQNKEKESYIDREPDKQADRAKVYLLLILFV